MTRSEKRHLQGKSESLHGTLWKALMYHSNPCKKSFLWIYILWNNSDVTISDCASWIFSKRTCVINHDPTNDFLPSKSLLSDRVTLCKHQSDDIFQFVNSKTFKNVDYILRVLAVLPVTTATPKRMFSTLRRIKTYLRNTMGQERLNGLASLNIHTHIELTEDEILVEFFKKPRKFTSVWDSPLQFFMKCSNNQ